MFCTIEDAWGQSSTRGQGSFGSPNFSESQSNFLGLQSSGRKSKELSNLSDNMSDKLDNSLKNLDPSSKIKSINNDKISNKEMFEQSDKPESFKLNEYTFHQEKNTNNEEKKQDMYNKYMELKEMFEDKYSPVEEKVSEVCLALDNHLSKCERCRSKYLFRSKSETKHLEQYNSSIDLSKISLYINSNKDTITIFLFGVLIILLLQLFSSK